MAWTTKKTDHRWKESNYYRAAYILAKLPSKYASFVPAASRSQSPPTKRKNFYLACQFSAVIGARKRATPENNILYNSPKTWILAIIVGVLLVYCRVELQEGKIYRNERWHTSKYQKKEGTYCTSIITIVLVLGVFFQMRSSQTKLLLSEKRGTNGDTFDVWHWTRAVTL